MFVKPGVTYLVAILVGRSLLGMVGCTHYAPRQLDPVAVSQHFARQSLANPDMLDFVRQYAQPPSAVWPPSAWGLKDLTLAAFYFHPDLDVARAGWALAKAEQRTAGERPNPSLEIAPGVNATTRTPSPWILSSFLGLTVETMGKRDIRKEQAQHLQEAAQLHIAAIAWQVRSRVRQNLSARYVEQKNLHLLEQQQELQDENVRRTEERYEAGDISAFERAQARLAADQTRLAVRDAEQKMAEIDVALSAAVGLPAGALDGIPLSFEELDKAPPDITFDEALKKALFNRVDLLALLATYAASETALRLEIAKQYPDINAGPGYEFDQGASKWSLGLNFPLPLFNQNQGGVAEAEARRKSAAAQFYLRQSQVEEAVARSMAAYRGALDKKADVETMVVDVEMQIRRAEALNTAGAISAAELVAIRLELTAVSLLHLTVLSEIQRATGVLEDVIQSPLGVLPAIWQETPRTATHSNRTN